MRKGMLLICFFLFVAQIFAQQKARKIDEFNLITNCEEITARADIAFQELEKDSSAKLYFIYYEAKQQKIYVYNREKKQREIKLVNPIREDALNRAKALTFYLTKWRKAPKHKLILIDGGYRENSETEIWIVPLQIEPPKPTPTVDAKDIKFNKGKSLFVKDCGRQIANYK